MRLGIGGRLVRLLDAKEFEVVRIEESSPDSRVFDLLADDDTEYHATEAQIWGHDPTFRIVKT